LELSVKEFFVKIKVFEIVTKEDTIYRELLSKYETNSKLKALLNQFIIPPELVMAGDFRLITMIERAIDMSHIKVYLVKDIENNIFLWAIGKFTDDERIQMFPLLKKQSKALQLEIRKALILEGLMTESNIKLE